MPVPGQVASLLRNLVARLPTLLGRNLVGIYLYGSLTQRAFDSDHSDVDCIVVTNRALSDTQFRRINSWLHRAAETNPWVLRLQILFLIRNEVLTMDSNACLFQFGRLERSGSDGNPIIWLNVLKSGVVLHGPHPDSFVPPISRALLVQALERELGYLRAEIDGKPDSEWRDVPFYRVYVVMTLCRILYSFRHGTIASKPRAAKWAVRHVPQELRGIITRAAGISDATRWPRLPLSPMRRLLRHVEAHLRAGGTKSDVAPRSTRGS